jgi:hypothetical protein
LEIFVIFCRRSSEGEGRVKKVVVMERGEGAREADGERVMEVTQMMMGREERGLTTSLAPADGKERMVMMKLQDPMLTCMNNYPFTHSCIHACTHIHTQN